MAGSHASEGQTSASPTVTSELTCLGIVFDLSNPGHLTASRGCHMPLAVVTTRAVLFSSRAHESGLTWQHVAASFHAQKSYVAENGARGPGPVRGLIGPESVFAMGSFHREHVLL